MATLQKLSHGEPQWEAKVNAAIEFLNSLGGAVSNLEWSKFTDDGIVYQNGFQDIGGVGQGKTGYRYAVVGNRKIVELQVALHLLIDPGNSTSQLTALTLPGTVSPTNVGSPHLINAKYALNCVDGRVDATKTGDSWWTGSGSYYLMHVMYTSDN